MYFLNYIITIKKVILEFYISYKIVYNTHIRVRYIQYDYFKKKPLHVNTVIIYDL